MLYFDFEAGNTSYKLRLTTKTIMELEKRIGCNPLMVFGSTGERIPAISEMVAILWASLQPLQHGITLDNAANIFDTYLEEHTMTDFIPVIMEIYKVSGIISKDKPKEEVEKNF